MKLKQEWPRLNLKVFHRALKNLTNVNYLCSFSRNSKFNYFFSILRRWSKGTETWANFFKSTRNEIEATMTTPKFKSLSKSRFKCLSKRHTWCVSKWSVLAVLYHSEDVSFSSTLERWSAHSGGDNWHNC